MTLYWVRHADKEKGDYRNRHLPHLDQPISSYGKEQAKALCRYFLDKDIGEIFISEYKRTRQTIQSLSEELHISPTTDSRLNEIDLGMLIGLTDEQFEMTYPDIWEAYQAGDRDFTWPGGESGTEAQSRVIRFLDELDHRSSDKIIVTHDGIIRLLLCHLLTIPVYHRFKFTVGTTGITEIAWNRERSSWKIIRINQELL